MAPLRHPEQGSAADETPRTPRTEQPGGIFDMHPPGLNPRQQAEPAERLLAHRQRRHDALPGTQNPGGVISIWRKGTVCILQLQIWAV